MNCTALEKYLSHINKTLKNPTDLFEKQFDNYDCNNNNIKKVNLEDLNVKFPCSNQFILGGHSACVCICTAIAYKIYESNLNPEELNNELEPLMRKGILLWEKWRKDTKTKLMFADVKTILDFLHSIKITELYCEDEDYCIETNLDDNCVKSFRGNDSSSFKTFKFILENNSNVELVVFIVIIRDISILIVRKLDIWYLFDSHGHVKFVKTNNAFYIKFDNLNSLINTIDELYKHEDNQENITNVSILRMRAKEK